MHLAMDIGGTTTRVAKFSTMNSLVPDLIDTFPTSYSYDAQVLAIRASVDKLTKMKLQSVGVSFGVGFSPGGKTILAAGKMNDYIGKHFVRDLSRTLGAKVRVAHDCVCALLAHQHHKFTKNVRCFAYVTVSTGIGAAVAIRADKTTLVFRSRIAHQIVDASGLVCKCGQRGCLAAYCDGEQLEFRAKKAGNGHTSLNCHEFARHLAQGMVSLSWILPVEVIFTAGGFFESNPQLFPLLHTAFSKSRVTGHYQHCVVRKSPLKNYAPLIGANLLRTTQKTIIFN